MKKTPLVSVIVGLAVGLALFQNFSWYRLIELDEDSLSADINSQVDWQASLDDGRRQLGSIFDQFAQSVAAKVGTIGVSTSDPNEQFAASAALHEFVRQDLNSILERERAKYLNPIVLYSQDGSYYRSTLPAGAFQIELPVMQDGRVVSKGNEEYADVVKGWHRNVFLLKRATNGGDFGSVVLGYPSYSVFLQFSSTIASDLASGVPSRFVETSLGRLSSPAGTWYQSTEATSIRQVVTAARAAMARLTLYNLRTKIAARYLSSTDEMVNSFSSLGVRSLREFGVGLNGERLYYNGDDARPLLTALSHAPDLTDPTSIRSYVDVIEGRAVPAKSDLDGLNDDRTTLLAASNRDAYLAERSKVANCYARVNNYVNYLNANPTTVQTFVSGRASAIAETLAICNGASRIDLSRGMGFDGLMVSDAFVRSVREMERKKKIEDDFNALKVTLAESSNGRDLLKTIDFIEANYKAIDRVLASLPEFENYSYGSTSGGAVSKDSSTTWVTILENGQTAKTASETVLDFPSSIRRMVVQSDFDVNSAKSASTAFLARGVFNLAKYVADLGNCHINVESKVGERIKALHDLGRFSEVKSLVKTLSDGHVWSYCAKTAYAHSIGLTSYSDYMPTKDSNPDPIVSKRLEAALAILYRTNLANQQKALIENLGLSPLFSVNQMSRANASFVSNACEKSIPTFKKNLNYNRSTAFYLDAKNPACYGIEGGVKIPVYGYQPYYGTSSLDDQTKSFALIAKILGIGF